MGAGGDERQDGDDEKAQEAAPVHPLYLRAGEGRVEFGHCRVH